MARSAEGYGVTYESQKEDQRVLVVRVDQRPRLPAR